MLNQTKCLRRKANRSGSVMLAVVVMTMVVLSLATICLNVVTKTAKATSRNVQRTQAKITAEAALTEFIKGYKQGQTDDPNVENDKIYERLSSIASGHTKSNPVVYKVGLTGESDDDFAHNYGATEIHIYTVSGSTFKVEAETTFSTQTQTASITFATSTNSSSIPSNTIESKKGNVVGTDQIAFNVDGNVYYENENHSNIYKRISRSSLGGHVYCEMSVAFDDQNYVNDVYNKSINNIYQKKNRYFNQAPTITIDGYMTCANNMWMGTEVGKSDMNKANTSFYDDPDTEYPNGGLGGYDGYLCVYEKILAFTAGNYRIGATNSGAMQSGTNNLMDVYCRGYVDGDAFYGANRVLKYGPYDFSGELASIEAAFPGYFSGTQKRDNKFKVNGNFYCYRNDGTIEAGHYEDGAFIMACHDCSSAYTKAFEVGGDMYIDGNMYLYSQSGNWDSTMITIGGQLHMPSSAKIYVCTGDGSTFTAYSPSAAATLPMFNITGRDDGSGHNVKVLEANIDKDSEGRNRMPSVGYVATTGDGMFTDNRDALKLSNAYDGCSSNDIFTMDARHEDINLWPKAQNISHKFADAMLRPLVLDDPTRMKTFIDPEDGVEKKVWQIFEKSSDGKNDIIQINASCKLSSKQVMRMNTDTNAINRYIINVTKEDIVIAVPVGDMGCQFKIFVQDPVNEPHYVYFMYYLEGEENKCLYLNNSSIDVRPGSGNTSSYALSPTELVSIDTTDGSQTYDCYAYDKYAGGVITDPTSGLIVYDEPNTRRDLKIGFGSSGQGTQDRFITADYRLTLPAANELTDSTVLDPVEVKNSIIASMDAQVASETGKKIDNVIMFLIPDYVSVYINNGNCAKVQGVLYAWNSQVEMKYSGGALWYGQIKADRFKWTGDNSGTKTVFDMPMGSNSLLSYADKNSAGAGTPTEIAIQYYEY